MGRKLDVRTVPTITRKVRTCCLCGQEYLHGCIEGPDAPLIFRAHQDGAGRWWVPVKMDDYHRATCPDPGPETKPFWHDKRKREAYKIKHLKQQLRRRGELH